MSLILAVEPDRRQAKELSSLVRRHLRAEIVIADSGAAALEALAGRVPDLILTPALLGPRDEAVLTGWLRELGDAGAHLQTLATPILAAPQAQSPSRENGGIFGRLRDQPQSAGDGCDPAVFAEQVTVYLERAAGERATRGAMASTTAPLPAPAPVLTATADEDEAFELDEIISLDDLIIEGPSFDKPAPVEPPPVERVERRDTESRDGRNRSHKKAEAPPAAPAPKVDEAVLKAWEAELGVDAPSDPAPPLWRVGEHHDAAPLAVEVDVVPLVTARGSWGGFDPTQPHFAALLRRLDEVAAGPA